MWRALGLALIACLFAGVASAQRAPLIPQNKAFHGPGSPGFLPNCSGNFLVQNFVYGTSNSQIGVAPWSLTGSVGASLGSTTDTAPDGSATAVDINFNAISSTAQYSLLSQPVGTSLFANFYDWTEQVWVRVVTPPASGHFSVSLYNQSNPGPLSNGNYATKPIPQDGQWHLLTNYIPANWTLNNGTGHTVIFQIGADGRDTANQPSTVGAGTVAVWEPQFSLGHSEGDAGWPWVPNLSTTAPSLPNEFTLKCPASIAFRDFGSMKPWVNSSAANYNASSGIAVMTKQNASAGSGGIGVYEQGGVGNPFAGDVSTVEQSGTYAGQFIGFSSFTDGISQNSPATHNDWPGTLLYACKTAFNCSEATVGSPQLVIPGYVFPASSATKGGTPPCTASCSGTNPGIANTNVSITSAGVVTITGLTAAPNYQAGALLTVSGFTGASASLINSPSPGYVIATGVSSSPNSVSYQSPTCSSSCSISTLSGTGSLTWVVPWNSYTLHGSWVPRRADGVACTVNSATYKYCLLFSAESNPDGGGGQSTFLAYSNSADHGWCVYNQYFPTNCNNGSPTAGGTSTPANAQPLGVLTSFNSYVGSGQLPTLICLPVGCPSNGTLYAITSPTNQNAIGFTLWTSTPGQATTWNFAGVISDQTIAQASFTATLNATTTMTVTGVTTGGFLEPGQLVSGSNIPAGTHIVSGPIAGGNGTYTLDQAATGSGSGISLTSTFPTPDWDAPASHIDPDIHLNKCGFFEFPQTSYLGSGWEGPYAVSHFDQAITEAVSDDIRGPYYRLQNAWFGPFGNGAGQVTAPSGSLFPWKANGTIYNGGTTAGETYLFEDGLGTLYWSGNTDNGSNASSGVVAYMHDYCQ